jgi:hypothetical protein
MAEESSSRSMVLLRVRYRYWNARQFKNTVLMDGEDITLILTEMISFPETLDKKIHAAQTRGSFYINAVTGKSKIKS